VFSSSATVSDNPQTLPLTESESFKPVSYGYKHHRKSMVAQKYWLTYSLPILSGEWLAYAVSTQLALAS